MKRFWLAIGIAPAVVGCSASGDSARSAEEPGVAESDAQSATDSRLDDIGSSEGGRRLAVREAQAEAAAEALDHDRTAYAASRNAEPQARANEARTGLPPYGSRARQARDVHQATEDMEDAIAAADAAAEQAIRDASE